MTPALLSPRHAVAMVAAALVLSAWAAPAAQARIWVGVGVPFVAPMPYYPPPFYYPPPPVYYPPPPVYYPPPPPIVYTPPQYTPAPYTANPAPVGQTCYAGAYTCPMERPIASGSACYCLSNGGQHVPGRAN
jgi:hypothetical protein